MTKNELIEKLSAIEGNPEVVFWNGYVGDWMRLSDEITESALVRETPEFVRTSLEQEVMSDGLPASNITDKDVEEAMEHREWDLPNPYVTGERFNKWYGDKRQPIVVLNAEARGKTSYSRAGDMSY